MPFKKSTLKNKTAIVTGGNGILGSQFVKGLIDAGAKVCILDIHDEIDNIFKGYLDKITYFKCDITSKESINECIGKIIKNNKTIDILLNNAATKTKNIKDFFKSFEEYELETWQEVMKVNVDGMFLVAQSVASLMKKQKSGSIIQISSIYGLFGPDSKIYKGSEYMGTKINTPAVYSASKAAVIGLTKWLAVYLAEHNIRVNCVVPGGVESGQNDSFISNYSKKVPMGRMAESKEIVPSIIYLASDSSSYITGQTIIIDGGFTSW